MQKEDGNGSRDEVAGLLLWLSGCPSSSPEKVLGVEPGADSEAVRRAFFALARRLHPDTASDASPARRSAMQDAFIRVNEAYRALSAGRPAAGGGPEGHGPAAAGAGGARGRTPDRGAPRETGGSCDSPEARPQRSAGSFGSGRPVPAAEFAEGQQRPSDSVLRQMRVERAIAAAAELTNSGDAEGAVSLLHEVISLGDDELRRRVRLQLARAYVLDRRWHRHAAALLHELLRDHPDDADVLAQMGALYAAGGLQRRAEAALRRALAADPRHAEARARLRALVPSRGAGEDRPGPVGFAARLRGLGRAV